MQTIIATTTFIAFAAATVALLVGVVATAVLSCASVESLRDNR